MFRSQLLLLRHVILIAALLMITHLCANAQSDRARYLDLLQLMGAGLAVPGIAAYCEKFVMKNPALIDAAKRWNERHDEVLKFIVSEIKRTGDLSADKKRQLNVLAYKALMKEMEAIADKVGYCRDAAKGIDAGDLDFSKREDTAPLLSRLGVAPILLR